MHGDAADPGWRDPKADSFKHCLKGCSHRMGLVLCESNVARGAGRGEAGGAATGTSSTGGGASLLPPGDLDVALSKVNAAQSSTRFHAELRVVASTPRGV